MELSASQAGAERKSVTVILDQDKKIKQPGHFRVCPLGMQMCSDKMIPEYEVMDCRFDLSDLGGAQEEINCCGVVVNCQQEKNSSMYRIWVKFLDLPEKTQQSIQKLAKHSKLLCPYCENF